MKKIISFVYWIAVIVTAMVASHFIIKWLTFPAKTKYLGPVGFKPDEITA
jgi:hypothetical protein